MMSILKRSSPYVFALFPLNLSSDPDKANIKNYVKKDPPKEHAFDRVKQMFTLNEYGEVSPELTFCLHVSTMGLFVGGTYGGIIRGRSAFISFVDNNEATMFQNHLDAKRRLQDAVTLSVAKGAIQWGWRTFFFTSIYAFTSTLISVIRGKSGIIEHTDAGFVAGAIYNVKNGIRGAFVGGLLGGALGTIFGCLFYCILVLSGQTIEEIRFWTYEWKEHRRESLAKSDRERQQKQAEEDIIKITEELTKAEVGNLPPTPSL